MTIDGDNLDALRSDEVLSEGMLASDARSLGRRLACTGSVQSVARYLASEPDRIRALCAYLDDLLAGPCEPGYRHPDDMAICAGLLILADSSLSEVRSLFSRLHATHKPSLTWVTRMARYCAERGTATEHSRTVLPTADGSSACAPTIFSPEESIFSAPDSGTEIVPVVPVAA